MKRVFLMRQQGLPTDEDPAPALGRGITILRHLVREGNCSLEQLARTFSWPKASVLRLMRSLSMAGVVVRDPATKRYRAVMHLVESDAASQQLRARTMTAVSWLIERVPHTVEVYIYCGDRMVMIDRAEPFGQVVTVRARVGFARHFDEADALTQIAGAFASAPNATRRWAWAEDGRSKHHIDETAFARLLMGVRTKGVAWDLDRNLNGVRRCAVPLCDESGRLVGALSLALVGCEVDLALGDLLIKASTMVGVQPAFASSPPQTLMAANVG
jgi:DNA-binding IclR family transcriptional regulator